MNPEDQRPIMFASGLEDRNAEICYHDDVNDYFDYGMERLRPRRRLLPLPEDFDFDYFHSERDGYFPCYDYVDYFHDVDYYVYFFHVPKISFYPASNPKIPSFHTCAP